MWWKQWFANSAPRLRHAALLAAVTVCVLDGAQTAFAQDCPPTKGDPRTGWIRPKCSVTAVITADRLTSTGVPLEGSSVTVSYTVTANALYAPTVSGNLTWNISRSDGIADTPSGSIRVENLATNETRGGRFSFKAPTAGKLSLRLRFGRDDEPYVGEFQRPTCCSDDMEFNVATRFVVSLESIHIHNTRSRLKDTDFAHLEGSFGGQGVKTADKYLGDLAGGDHQTLMPIGPFECVPGDELGELGLQLIILNHGYEGSASEQLANFKNSIDGAVAAGFDISNYRDGVSVWLTGHLLFPDCDGPVFVDAKPFSTSLLNLETFRTGINSYAETIEAITDRDADACNHADAHYKANFMFFRNGTIYRVKVTTGDVDDAGMFSHAYITLKGDNGESREVHLDDYKENFHRGVTEEFLIACQDLGEVRSVTLRHDNKNDDRTWFVDKVTVEDIFTNKSWLFPCGKWFADNRDDNQISRVLTP